MPLVDASGAADRAPAPVSSEVVRDAFERHYRDVYGRLLDGLDISVATLRTTVTGLRPEVDLRALGTPDSIGPRELGSSHVCTSVAHGSMPSVLDRGALAPGDRVDGPAILEQPDATTVLPPGWTAGVDELGNLSVGACTAVSAVVPDPTRSAVVLIDLQNDFLHPDGAYARGGQSDDRLAALPDHVAPLLGGGTRCGRGGRVQPLHHLAGASRRTTRRRAPAGVAPVPPHRRFRPRQLGPTDRRRAR